MNTQNLLLPIKNNCAVAAFLLLAIQGFAQPFITTWKTDNPGTSCSSCITIPTMGGGYNYDVDWDNDGTFDEFGITGNITHDFGTPGTYTIRLQGAFPRIFFNNTGDRRKILSVDQWGSIVWSSMERAFTGASNLTSSANDSPDLTNVTNMNAMFGGASTFNSNINSWDVSNVTNLSEMFLNATAFNGDLNSWDVSNVTNMNAMFYLGTSFNGNISTWNVSNVTKMSGMFNGATYFNGDICSWDVSNVTTMFGMFQNATPFNRDISSWDVSNVTDMSFTFYGATAFNQNLGDWNISSAHLGFTFVNCGISIFNYDNTLIGWESQGIFYQDFEAYGLIYCNGEAARTSLINNYGWNISGDSKDCNSSWTNGSSDSQWDTPTNWNVGTVPTTQNILTIGIGGTVEVSTSYTADCESLNITAGAALDLKSGSNLTFSGSGITINHANATLKGIGTITGNVAHPIGFVAPGASPGTLTITGNYTNSGGTLDMEINGTTAGTEYDRLNISGTATFNITTSKLNLTFGYNPAVNDFFDIVTAGSVSGNIGAGNITFSGGDVTAVSLSYPGGYTLRVTVSGVLPVELSSFQAFPEREKVRLEWETQSETNNSHFDLEHSTDGRTFEKMTEMQAAGTTLDKQAYTFTHSTPSPGMNYYRLKQVDLDGTFSYSKIISVYFGKEEENNHLSVYPNPVAEAIFLENRTEEILGVELFDRSGKYISSIEMNGLEKTNIPAGDLEAGVYFLKINDGRRVYMQRFLKQ